MLNISISLILKLTCIVFSIGLVGILLNCKNILIVIVFIELLLSSVNFNFAGFSIYLGDVTGQIFILFVLAIADAEFLIGTAVIRAFHKLKNPV